jgi:hypothetical protein
MRAVGLYVDSRLPNVVRNGPKHNALAAGIVIDRSYLFARVGLGRLHLSQRDAVITEPHIVIEWNM